MKLSLILAASLALCASAAMAADGPVKLHPVKDYCLKSTLSGSMVSGTSETYSRDYGRIVVTKDKTKAGFGGFSQTTESHNTTIGPDIYNINPKTMTGSKAKNPVYDTVKNADQKNLANSTITALGYTDTGVDKTIVGTMCNVYSGPLGSACFTPRGVALETNVMGTSMIATYYKEGCRGDDADFTLYKRAKITDAPDISEILKMMGQ